jgi:hypothetical protein
VDNSRASVYDIVGHRPLPDGWLPDYRPVCHRRSVWRSTIPGFVLIGLGAALFLATWAHRRNNHD